jgi:LmbE family N-acetylglucosaminyl deacetylase
MPSAIAICAHPDDIEFFMAGALLHLASRGWETHYVCLCDGSRGSTTMGMAECAATRLQEAKDACKVLGAKHHDPIYPDMEAAYTTANLQKVTALIRQTRPSIVLTHPPSDYMEDHETCCRLAVSAAFSRGMPNLQSDPPVEPYYEPVTVYHCQPVGNTTPLGDVVKPHFYIDDSSVVDDKVKALACHASQKQWLDESQGQDSYLTTLRDISKELGSWSGKYQYAEGWRRHSHMGFCGPDDDPLVEALQDIVVDTREY